MFFDKLFCLIASLVLLSTAAFAGYAVTYATNAFGYSDASSYVTFDTTSNNVYGYTSYPTNYYGYNTGYSSYNTGYSGYNTGSYYYNGSYYYYPSTYNYTYRPTYYVPTYYTYTYVTPVYYTYPTAYRTGWYYA